MRYEGVDRTEFAIVCGRRSVMDALKSSPELADVSKADTLRFVASTFGLHRFSRVLSNASGELLAEAKTWIDHGVDAEIERQARKAAA